MIENYIQSVSEDAINKNNFLLLERTDGVVDYSEKRCILIKNIGISFIILGLYNLKRYSKEEIQQEIEDNKSTIERIMGSPIEYRIFKVFIGNDDLSYDIREWMKGLHLHNISMRKFVKPIYINMSKKQIQCYFDGKFPDEGITKVLKKNLGLECWKEFDEKQIKSLNKDKHKDYRVIYSSKYAITVYTFVALNILGYIIAKLKCTSLGITYIDVMYRFGIKDNGLIKSGEYFRLLSPMFLHGGIIHLCINCISLCMVGPICEKMYGNLKFIIIYVLSGVGGTIASFAFSNSLSLGASGAIFGIMGALIYFGTQKPIACRNLFGTSLVIITAMNLLLGVITPGIDNLGHIGGLVGGFLLAGLLKYQDSENKYISRICLGLIIVIYGGMLYLGFR